MRGVPLRAFLPPSCLALLLLLAAPVVPGGPTLGNAVFVDGRGAHAALFEWSGPCNGEVAVTVTLRPLPLVGEAPEVRATTATSTMVPDLCMIACLDCPVPFVWTVAREDGSVSLAGGGMAPAGAVLAGPFQDGTLDVRLLPLPV